MSTSCSNAFAGILRFHARKSKPTRSKRAPKSSCATFLSRPPSGSSGNFSGSHCTCLKLVAHSQQVKVTGSRRFFMLVNFLFRFKKCFSTFGELKTVRLPKKATGAGSHRGFGFIDFITKQDAKVCFLAFMKYVFSLLSQVF